MPIILAIEPDRHQASCLAAAVRRRVAAELILADTTERALDAIGDRVPDMVLVPALLAPQDDAALAAALRVIAAATHVRTLTIPVLSSGRATPAAHDGARRPRRHPEAASPTSSPIRSPRI
jgi:PleD family two-component response regulator